MQNLNSDPLNPINIPTAGRVNFNTSASNDYLTNEAFKTLRSNVLFCGTDIKIILITSTNEGEGKSTVSAAFAKSFADISKRTLLIDADMRKSAILRRNIKSQNVLGLSELLSGQAEISQIIYNTQDPNFDVIFSGRFPPNPVELLSSPKFKEYIEIFSKLYDYIIIDSPPLGPVIDAAVISAFCDGAILIVSPGKTLYQQALSAKEQISKSGCRILGAVINETDPKHSDRSRSGKKNYYYYTDKANSPKR